MEGENNMDQDYFANQIGTVLQQVNEEIGHVNILIAGGTGVGKSTLINSVFQGNVAETGIGEPVTKEIVKIDKTGIPLSIYDTRGLEMKDYNTTLEELTKLIKKLKTKSNPNDHIHAAWVCIAETSARVQPAEEELVKMLSEEGIPVIVVITKAYLKKDFQNTIKDKLKEAKKVIRVNSIETEIEVNDQTIKLPQSGLDHLVDVTFEVVPDGQKSAFIASQKVDIEKKKNRSQKIVATAAAIAAGIGLVPIPFSDAMSIVPIQILMIARISAIFGLSLDKVFMNTMVTSTITGSVGTITGKAIVSNFLKALPGFNVSAGIIHAGVASGITTTFGQAYITVLARLFSKNDGVPPTGEEVLKAFKEQYEKSKSEYKHEEHDQESESKSKHEEHDEESEDEQDE